MSLSVVATELQKAGTNIKDVAQRIQILANKANSINSSISNCYMQGGVGGRAGIAASRMCSTATCAGKKASDLQTAASIYQRTDDKLMARGQTVASTIKHGYNVTWANQPQIKSVLATNSSLSYTNKISQSYVGINQQGAGLSAPSGNTSSVSNVAVQTPSDVKDSEYIKILEKLIGKAGFLGSFLAFFVKPIATWASSGFASIGVTGAKSVVSLIKDGHSTIKGLYDWQKSNEKLAKLARMDPEKAKAVRWKRLVGLNDVFSGTASKASSWSTRFYNNFHKLKGPFESYKSGGHKGTCAWAGLALTVASNGISNYNEYKSGSVSAERAVAETITETAIDIGKNWLIGAAVAAGVAATVGSAPVLVVGALTVGVSMGLDYACKKITGANGGEEKGLTETVSDLVLDVGSAAIEAGKKAVSGISNAIKSFKPSIKLGLKPLFV